MPRTRGRSRKAERQLGELSDLMREIRLETQQGRKEVRDLQAQGAQAVTQLNHILQLGKQEFGEVKGDLYDTNQALAGFKTQLETLDSKINRVLEQTSMVQAARCRCRCMSLPVAARPAASGG